MRRGWLLLAGVVFAGAAAIGGCSIFRFGRAPADTPERAFETLRGALESGDWAAVYAAAASPGTQRRFDTDFEKVKRKLAETGGDSMFAESVVGVSRDEYLRMSARDFFVTTSEASGRANDLLVMIPDRESMRNARIVDTKIEGDDAMLIVELADGPRPLEMFRENGRWYFQLLDLD